MKEYFCTVCKTKLSYYNTGYMCFACRETQPVDNVYQTLPTYIPVEDIERKKRIKKYAARARKNLPLFEG